MERLEQEIKKCLAKRKVSKCSACCRFDECWNGKPKNFPNANIELLIGAIVWDALDDLEAEIPPLSKCKTTHARSKRQQMIYNKAKAEAFFNGSLFKVLNVDLGYLRRAYAKAKIHESRY